MSGGDEVGMDSGFGLEGFQLLERLAIGGMSQVWRGVERRLGRPVAVKLITPPRASRKSFRTTFKSEVRAMTGLDHPGIVRIYDYGEISEAQSAATQGQVEAGAYWLAMELVPGGTLSNASFTRAGPALKVLLLGLLDALAHAHARGVIHLDIKPDNILLVDRTDPVCGAKLTDFGIARAFEPPFSGGELERRSWLAMVSNADAAGQVAGTPWYMAPEQFLGDWREMGPFTDLYALGCVTYELATGRPPFNADSPLELARAHWSEPRPPLDSRVPYSDAFEAWIHRMLAREPSERFRCAPDAAWALQQLELFSSEAAVQEYTRLQTAPTVFLPQAVSLSGNPILQTNSSGMRRHRRTTLQQRLGLDALEPTAGGASSSATGGTAIGRISLQGGPNRPTLEGAATDASAESLLPALHPRVGDVPPMPSTWKRPGDKASVRTSATAHADSSPPESAGSGRDRASTRQGLAGDRLFSLRPPPLLGREAERDRLWSALQAVAADGQARAVIVRGPGGMGLTHLVEWLSLRALEAGVAHVLSVFHSEAPGPMDGLAPMLQRQLRCTGLTGEALLNRVHHQLLELGMEEPWHREVLAGMLAARATPERVERNDRRRPGETTASRTSPPSSPQPPPLVYSTGERFAALTRFLECLSEHRPVVIRIEEPQWGAEALSFVAQLLRLRNSSSARVLILLTLADELLEQQSREASMLAELTKESGAEVLTIGPLPAPLHHHLVREVLGLEPTLAERVERHTAGSPLFALQLVGEWLEAGWLLPEDSGWVLRQEDPGLFPESLSHLWMLRLRRVLGRHRSADASQEALEGGVTLVLDPEMPQSLPESLDPPTLQALQLAAFLGLHISHREWTLACRMAGLRPPDQLLELMLQENLFLRMDDGGPDGRPDTFTFTHPRLRACLEQLALEDGSWVPLHLACATMLENEAAGDPLNKQLRLVHHLRCGDALEPAQVALLEAARMLEARSEFRQALELLRQRDEILTRLKVPAADPRWGQGWLREAACQRALGALAKATELLSRLTEQARSAPWDELLPYALRLQAAVAQNRGDYQKAAALAREALPGFERMQDSLGIVMCLRSLAMCLMPVGSVPEIAEHLQRALAICEKEGLLEERAQVLLAWGRYARIARHPDNARTLYLEASRVFEQLGNRRGVADAQRELGVLCADARDADGALTHYYEAVGLYEQIGSGYELSYLLSDIALMHELKGELELAEAGLHESIAFEEGIGAFGHALIPRYNLAALLVRTERYEEARKVVRQGFLRAQPDPKEPLYAALHTVLLPAAIVTHDANAWRTSMNVVNTLKVGRHLDPEDQGILELVLKLALSQGERAWAGEVEALLERTVLLDTSPAQG